MQLGKLFGAAFWTLLAQAGERLPSHRNADPFLLLCTTGRDSELHCYFSLSFWMVMTVNATQKTQALLRSSASNIGSDSFLMKFAGDCVLQRRIGAMRTGFRISSLVPSGLVFDGVS